MNTALTLTGPERVIWAHTYNFFLNEIHTTVAEALVEADHKIMSIREMSKIIDKSGYRY
jgi:hypothetical protein